MAGRPRGVDDAVILRATAEVIGQVGPAKLTLAAVAREVGMVPGTLVQRFGSKRGLLLTLAEQSAQDARTLPKRARAEHDSALAALTAMAVDQLAPMVTPEAFANHLAFLCVDLTDPEFHQHALAIHEAQGEAIRTLLAEAVADGELTPDTNVETLTRIVRSVIAGAGLTWALDREGTLPHRLAQQLDDVLAPHLSPTSQEAT